MKQENLPMGLKNSQLAVTKRINKRMIEGIKRVGKIILSAGVGLTGVAISAIGGPIISSAAMCIGVAGLANAGIDAIYKKMSKDSMFVQRKNTKGEIYISQSAKDFKSFQKMNGFNSPQKAAMMGLELLVGLQSIKQQFEDKGIITEQARDGENHVYPQIYRTTTHGINTDAVEALEALGYLQIERKEPKRKSNLFFEKLGFGQYQQAKEALLSVFSKEKAKKHEVQMYDLALKVTDKPINFEEIYQSYTELKRQADKTPKSNAIKRLGIIMEILRKKNIDIVTNEIGETIINYNAQESFANRMKREQTNSSNEYRKKVYIGDAIYQSPVQTQEGPTKDENVQDSEVEI